MRPHYGSIRDSPSPHLRAAPIRLTCMPLPCRTSRIPNRVGCERSTVREVCQVRALVSQWLAFGDDCTVYSFGAMRHAGQPCIQTRFRMHFRFVPFVLAWLVRSFFSFLFSLPTHPLDLTQSVGCHDLNIGGSHGPCRCKHQGSWWSGPFTPHTVPTCEISSKTKRCRAGLVRWRRARRGLWWLERQTVPRCPICAWLRFEYLGRS
jgi:hypothetical protein